MSERVPSHPSRNLSATPSPARRPAGPRQTGHASSRLQRRRQNKPDPDQPCEQRSGWGDHPTDMRPISLSVPAPLLESFKLFAKRTDTSQASVLMDAITAHHDHLVDLVTTSRPGPNNDGLFVRDTPRDTIPLSTLSLRMRAVNIDAIDQLVEASAATSRSHLCVAVLTAYLSTNR